MKGWMKVEVNCLALSSGVDITKGGITPYYEYMYLLPCTRGPRTACGSETPHGLLILMLLPKTLTLLRWQ